MNLWRYLIVGMVAAVALLIMLALGGPTGCVMRPHSAITVNVFSSRLVTIGGESNEVKQAVDGGATISSNAPSVSTPLF